MKKILTFFKWILYAMATQDQRIRWLYGKQRGQHCYYHSQNYWTGEVVVRFFVNVKPVREYLTFKEFFKTN